MSAVVATAYGESLRLAGDRTLNRQLFLFRSSGLHYPHLGVVLSIGKKRENVAYAGANTSECGIRDGKLWVGHASFDLTKGELAQVQAFLGLKTVTAEGTTP